MVKVKVLVEHGNSYGDAYAKAVGDEYDVPEDALSPLAGLVEPVADEKVTPKDKVGK